MKFLSSLDAKDRKLLLWCVGIALTLAVATGFLMPRGSDNDNPLPSSYLSGQHGARAAYETLLRSNYPIERWERPLSELAAQAGPETVVIFAEPYSREPDDIKAVRKIVERGGRVLSTGYLGGFILPGEAAEPPGEFNFAACNLNPEGLDALSGSGEVWMVPGATWQPGNPAQRIQYSCTKYPAVVEYDWGKGHIVSGPVPRRSKTAPSAAATTWICCSTRWGRATAIASTGTSRCMARFTPPGATRAVWRGTRCGSDCRCWCC